MHVSPAIASSAITSPGAVSLPGVRRDTIIAALLAACLGALLIVGVGFVHLEGIHDAAHDIRHAIGFPCH